MFKINDVKMIVIDRLISINFNCIFYYILLFSQQLMVCGTVQRILQLVWSTVVSKECNITPFATNFNGIKSFLETKDCWIISTRLRPNGIKNYAPTKCLQDIIYTYIFINLYIFIL
jgi:hypothetical protein